MVRYIAYTLSEHPFICFGVLYIIATASFLYEVSIWFLLIATAVYLVWLLKNGDKRFHIFVAILAIMLSWWNCDRVLKGYEHASEIFKKKVSDGSSVTGHIISDPKVKHTYTEYEIESLDSEYRFFVQTDKFPERKIGDKCTVSYTAKGLVQAREGYKKYLEGKDIVGVIRADSFTCTEVRITSPILSIRSKVYTFKSTISSEVEAILLEPHASLLLGMIFGDARLFDDRMEDDFRVTGTTHIIAASGFNVAILHKIGEVMFGRILPKRLRAVISFILIWLFALAANLSGSILRATFMLSLFLLAKIFGRVYRISEVLIISSFLLLLISPNLVKDVGFLLSVGATLGLILFVPVFEQLTSSIIDRVRVGRAALSGVGSTLWPTVSCSIGTIPVSFSYFGTASLLGVVPNLFLLPLVEYIYFLGLGSIILQMFLGINFSKIPFYFLYQVLDLFFLIIEFFSDKLSFFYDAGSFSQYTFWIILSLIPFLILGRYIIAKREGIYLG